ncbi:hypothetical protein RB653_009797 [Dictyostelium firmibasis]|uniref:ABC transporter domain-containing protein n=1 Tax=Dictyostelium firmibasis TaxID=79012 RepID=A0AAN7TKK8_9MYCE
MKYKTNTSNQFRAMFFKNATFIKRQKCSLGVQIAIPMALVIVLVILNKVIGGAINNNSDGTISSSYQSYNFDNAQGFFYTVNPNNITEVGYKDIQGNGTGLLEFVDQYEIYVNNTNVYVPYTIELPSAKVMNDIVLAKKQEVGTGSIGPLTFPIAGIQFNDFKPNNYSLDLTITCEEQYEYSYSLFKYNLIYTLSQIQTSFLNYLLNGNGVVTKSQISTMPYYYESTPFDITSILGGSFFPFALSFVLPLFMYSIVYDKQEKLRDLSLMMGLKMRNYWVMTFIFNFLVYTIIAVVIGFICTVSGISVFVKGSPFALFLLLLLWGLSMVSFAFFLSTFFKRTRAASIFGYFFVMVMVNLNSVLSSLNVSVPIFYYWIPILGFSRGMTVLTYLCGNGLCPALSAYTWDFEVSRILFWLFIDTIVYLILAVYLDKVLPREFGVPSHPLFFIKSITELFSKGGKKNGYSEINEKTKLINEFTIDGIIDEDEDGLMDEDVKNERDMVIKRLYNPDEMTLVVEGLRKQFPGRPKPALSDLYLTVKKGEVLGYLGANGAGKTTSISMLTGLYTPTSGTAHIAGLDIRYDMDKIHQVIGVVMQFDVLWEDLSCEETILYYTRLKGTPKEIELQSTHNILKEVNLFDVKERLVKQLSGGMKRRLSFGIAMTGDSSIIFLDEPSTGLSIEIRKELWGTINELKKNRSIILTTHSMQEADILSDRIAIVSQGKLQCIGTQSHLKQKFGDGYSVRVDIEANFINTHNPTELIKRFSPSATLSESFNGSYMYRLPRDTIISDLYEYLVLNKEQYHLQEWSLSQTSLEDVFLKISANDDTVN